MLSKSRFLSLVRGTLQADRFIVVSNREPYTHDWKSGRIVCTRPTGGVTSALEPLLTQSGGLWIAHGSGTADQDVVDGNSRIRVPSNSPSYTLKRVWLEEKRHQEHYSGLSNRGLWPLCHNVFQRPSFSPAEWESYRKVNEIFARAVIEETADQSATVFVQDYHFALLPRLIKNWNPRLSVAYFWHIPWPHPDTFFVFPWAEELLDGMLGSDVLGFQLNQHCTNFLQTVDRTGVALVDREQGRVMGGMNTTTVSHFPIGIDVAGQKKLAASRKTSAATEDWKRRLGPAVRVGIGIDRIDYTKGIPERIRALDLFLQQHPEWREKLVFLQVGVASRSAIHEYQVLAKQVDEQITAVNARWGTATWQPIWFLKESLSLEEMIALHRAADFCLVTALHDGMNLVAKEFVASRSDLDGVLVLSRFAGAAIELTSAVIVNPFLEEEIAQGILTALTFSQAEKSKRMSQMRAVVRANDVYLWAAEMMEALRHIDRGRNTNWLSQTEPCTNMAGTREVSIA